MGDPTKMPEVEVIETKVNVHYGDGLASLVTDVA